MARSSFGRIDKQRGGKYRARYVNPKTGDLVKAPTTFSDKDSARAWLYRQAVRLEQEAAGAPIAKRRAVPTLNDYAEKWIKTRKNPRSGRLLSASTKKDYRGYMARNIAPTFGDMRLDEITFEAVQEWHDELLLDSPTTRANVYGFLRAMMTTAVAEERIMSNPCRVRGGASKPEPATPARVLTPAEVAKLADAMPPNLALAVWLGAWCQLRIGEILELRRSDFAGTKVAITRGTTWIDGAPVVGPPKTRAGVRGLAIPPHVMPLVVDHLATYCQPGDDGLLFPSTTGRQMSSQGYAYHFDRAREAAGLGKSVRQHHLRHTGLTMAAQSGATIAELQRRAGHSTPNAAMRYQHATDQRDAELARRLSALASGDLDE